MLNFSQGQASGPEGKASRYQRNDPDAEIGPISAGFERGILKRSRVNREEK